MLNFRKKMINLIKYFDKKIDKPYKIFLSKSKRPQIDLFFFNFSRKKRQIDCKLTLNRSQNLIYRSISASLNISMK